MINQHTTLLYNGRIYKLTRFLPQYNHYIFSDQINEIRASEYDGYYCCSSTVFNEKYGDGINWFDVDLL